MPGATHYQVRYQARSGGCADIQLTFLLEQRIPWARTFVPGHTAQQFPVAGRGQPTPAGTPKTSLRAPRAHGSPTPRVYAEPVFAFWFTLEGALRVRHHPPRVDDYGCQGRLGHTW